ncbi:hypothetical protein BH10BAC6_BH10BAC6_01690 [soil metagenome]
MKRPIVLLLILISPLLVAKSGVDGHPVIEDRIGGRTVLVVSNVLRIRFQPGVARSATDAQQYLPDGCSVVHHFAPRNPAPSNSLRFFAKPVDSPAEQLTRTFAISYDGPIPPSIMAAKFKAANPLLDIVEPWYVPTSHALPNDPRAGQQVFLNVIHAITAWDKEQGGENIVIAVIDAGIDQTHEDLRSSLWTNTKEIPNNGVDDDGNGVVDDYQGANMSAADDGTPPGNTANSTTSHGTEVSGLAAATQNNGIGITGVGARCKLFPIKAGSTKERGLIYGYASLIYAADMGFDVVNTSWGVTGPFSSIDQSIIDYCIAKNMTVVCSSGNDGGIYENFPAAYRGALGVGETTIDDIVTSSTAYGVNADVLAPGRSALTTTSGNTYTTATSGTSFAAPIVAGMVALIRHRHPSLNALQAAEFARQSTVDVSSLNPQYGTLLPGRIDLQKMVDLDPMSMPSVRIVTTIVRRTDGTIATRYSEGDTLLFEFGITNYLGTVNDLRSSPYVGVANGWDVTILDVQSPPITLNTNSSATIGPFRIVMHTTTSVPLVLGLRFTNNNNYEDRDFINWRKPLSGATMQNERLAYSIFDNGWFGSSDEKDMLGVGFVYKSRARMMNFQSGFVVTEQDQQIASAFLNTDRSSDFSNVKKFAQPDTSVGIIRAPFGLDVTLLCRFPSQWGTAAVVLVTMKNTTATTFRNLSGGFFFDWDLGYAGRNNRVRLCPEAIPETFAQVPAAAEQISRDGYPLVIVCGVSANAPVQEATPQVAGFLFSDKIEGGTMSSATKIDLLKSGTSVQATTPSDIITLVGMRFTKDVGPGEERMFTIVIGVGDTEQEAQTAVREVLLNPTSVQEVESDEQLLAPNPATDLVRVSHAVDTRRIDIVDLAGTIVSSTTVETDSTATTIAMRGLCSGVYVVRVWGSNEPRSYRLMINR